MQNIYLVSQVVWSRLRTGLDQERWQPMDELGEDNIPLYS